MGAAFKLRGIKDARDAMRKSQRELDVGQGLVLRELADLFRKGEEQIFRTNGAIISRPWAPLADSTAKSRARLARKFGLSISPRSPRLVLFGDLKLAMTQPGGAHHVLLVGRRVQVAIDQSAINRHNRSTGAETGLTKKGLPRKVRGRARSLYPDNIIDLHQQGAANRPPRQIVGIPPGVRRSMDARVRRWLDSIVRIAGGR